MFHKWSQTSLEISKISAAVEVVCLLTAVVVVVVVVVAAALFIEKLRGSDEGSKNVLKERKEERKENKKKEVFANSSVSVTHRRWPTCSPSYSDVQQTREVKGSSSNTTTTPTTQINN